MRRPTLFLTITAVVALPIVAAAAFLKPSDLLTVLKFKGEPINFSYEVHGNADKIVFSMAARGAVQGTTSDDAKLSLQLSADVAGIEGQDAIRAKAQLRMVDRMLYVRLEGLDGTYQPEMLAGIMEEYGGKWYALRNTTAASVTEQYTDASTDQSKAMLLDIMDVVLTLTRTATASGNTYTLSLKPDAANAIYAALPDLRAKYPTLMEKSSTLTDLQGLSEAKDFLSRIHFSTKVLTTPADALRSVKYYLSATWDVEGKKGEGIFVGQMKKRGAPVSIIAPKDAIDVSGLLSDKEDPSDSPNACPFSDPRTGCTSKPSTRK